MNTMNLEFLWLDEIIILAAHRRDIVVLPPRSFIDDHPIPGEKSVLPRMLLHFLRIL